MLWKFLGIRTEKYVQNNHAPKPRRVICWIRFAHFIRNLCRRVTFSLFVCDVSVCLSQPCLTRYWKRPDNQSTINRVYAAFSTHSMHTRSVWIRISYAIIDIEIKCTHAIRRWWPASCFSPRKSREREWIDQYLNFHAFDVWFWLNKCAICGALTIEDHLIGRWRIEGAADR